MAQIQITDLNPSDCGFIEELTEEELLEINGGRWYNWVFGLALVAAAVCTGNPVFAAAGVSLTAQDTSI